MRTAWLCAWLLVSLVSAAWAEAIHWPMQMTNEGSVLTLYQPQVQSWDQYKILDFRVAFSLKPKGGKEVVGVLYMRAPTDVDMDKHVVLVHARSVEKINFPSLDASQSQAMGQLTRSILTPDSTLEISLEQVVACTPKEAPATTISVNNDPPVILVSTRPTILLQLEGKPVRAATGQEKLEFVVNANYPLFYDTPNKTYYLYDGLEWQKAPEPDQPWKFTGSLPRSIVSLAKDTSWAVVKGAVPAPTKADKNMPQVLFSDRLAELILFEGEPDWHAIDGTSLRYAGNTNSDVFYCQADKKFYFLTAGRWFSAPGLSGPWTFATTSLPADFASIPDSSPASSILAFVPGTDHAKDAVMIAQIPTTIEVNGAEAAKQVHIAYAGDPQFQPIEGTPLYYAVNTTDKVIKVSGSEYYACVQGIWFVSTTPAGPWQVASTIPAAIYSIPPSSQMYNVTYVTQVVTTTNTVQPSYTSGYTGVYVVGAPSGVIIVSGSGYYYPPYYYYPPHGYPIYYPYPVTYGPYAYHPYPYGGVAYHASYNPKTGMYTRSATAYSPYGSATVAQGYNSKTGTYARGASVSTPYGSRTAAQAYNPYTGTAASTHQGSSPYSQWGSSTVSKGGQTAQSAHVTTAQGTTGAVKTGSGDMYATKDGNVYKNTGNGWEQASGPQGKPSATPQAQAGQSGAAAGQHPTSPTAGAAGAAGTSSAAGAAGAKSGGAMGANSQELNKEAQNRQRGNTQAKQYQGWSGGGGGHSGGGRSGGGRR